MSTKTTSVYVIFSIFVMCNNIRGEETDRRWSISAGAKTRRVAYSFSSDYRGLSNWQNYIALRQSKGSLDLFDGTQPVDYEDGYIKQAEWSGLPIVGYSGHTGSEENRNGESYIVFHSTQYDNPTSQTTADANQINRTMSTGYIKTRYQLSEIYGGKIGVSLSSSLSHDSANCNTHLEQRISQDRTRYEFLYEYEDDHGGGHHPIGDADAWNDAGPFYDHYADPPQRNVTSQDTVVTGTLNGLMDAEVDIYWYELTLGLDWTQTLFNRLDLFALVGPTVHVLDWEMEHNTTWTVAGANSPATTTRASEDGTKTLVGGVAEIGINLYLDSDRRYFIEASGEYLYLEDVTLNAGAASVEIDPESWGGKLGIGMRL